VAVSFIGEGNWSKQKKTMICQKSMTNFIAWSTPRYVLILK